MSRFLLSTFTWVHDTLHKPVFVFYVCSAVIFLSLVLEGSLYQLWNLNKDQKILLSKIAKVQADTLKIQSKIKRVSDPRFLELEVRDQLDYANNGDLIFVFSDKQ